MEEILDKDKNKNKNLEASTISPVKCTKILLSLA